MKPMALVLQGGGALGAYEYGAVTALIEEGWQPVAVTGVSIGALTTAAVAGAKGRDVTASLRGLWDAITLQPVPFVPRPLQASLSLFGDPGFWTPRYDYLTYPTWTSYCDVSPMRQTLDALCDFDQLNDPSFVRLSVTATDILTGGQVTFSNVAPPPSRADAPVERTRLTADHFLASGSLPPGFPMTIIDGRAYWDGGLFDNTPIQALLDLLSDEEIDSLPIFVVDLFPTSDAVPANLKEVQERMLEISYENRFWAQQAGTVGNADQFVAMLETLRADLPQDSAARRNPSFQRLQRLRALKNLRVIEAPHSPMNGFMDFSAYGVGERFRAGHDAALHLLNPAQAKAA